MYRMEWALVVIKGAILWYADLSRKQRLIIWVVALFLSLITGVGGIFIVPVMLCLELEYESVNRKRRSDSRDE